MLVDFLEPVPSNLLDTLESGRQFSSSGDEKASSVPSREQGDSPPGPASVCRTCSQPLPVCARNLALASRPSSRVPPATRTAVHVAGSAALSHPAHQPGLSPPELHFSARPEAHTLHRTVQPEPPHSPRTACCVSSAS